MDSVIKIENLSYTVDNKEILKNINIEIEKGKFVSIIGPNGAGKTSLVDLVTKNNNKTSGKIIIDNRDIEKYSNRELAKKIGYVNQITTFDENFLVEDVVLMGRIPYQKMFECYSYKDKKIVTKAMEQTNILHLRKREVNSLSGGEKQRVSCARVIAQDTDILILDEPISNLDIYHQIEIMELLRQINQEKGITIVCILHDINMSLKYSDQTILLKDGELITKGNTQETITRKFLKEVFRIDAEIINTKKGTKVII